MIENISQYEIVKDYDFCRIYINDYKLYSELNDNKRVYYAVDSVHPRGNFDDERLLIGSTGSLLNAKYNVTNSDYFLNARNSYSLMSLYNTGIDWVTISPETTVEQIGKITDGYNTRYGKYPNIEYIVYGRIQLMVTKHCAIGEPVCNKCKSADYALEDIKGNIYPIRTDEKML